MTRVRALVVLLVVGAAIAAVFRPVCVPLSEEQLASFTAPIETRTDRDFYLTVFQQRDGGWMQCKTWISRAMFF